MAGAAALAAVRFRAWACFRRGLLPGTRGCARRGNTRSPTAASACGSRSGRAWPCSPWHRHLALQ
eukprot:12788111-Alexandrium_andersonii.AAC.1